MIRTGQTLTVEEELYCTKYELEILSGIVNLNMLERWLPGFCGAQTHKEHVHRYDWVKEFVKDKTVLDIACGTGYGSYKLAAEGKASEVTACDIDESTVQYASIRNRHPKITFETRDAETFEFSQKFDVITSFETIEHLRKPLDFLRNVDRVLSSDGFFFVSTPISNVPEEKNPNNIYHVTEWGFRRFQELIAGHFEISGIYLQLYKFPKPINMKLSARISRRLGITRYTSEPLIEKLEPTKWQPSELPEEKIGTEWKGYQILKCKKKSN